MKRLLTETGNKEIWKPGTMIYPIPAVLVSCGAFRAEYNILTVSWTGTICTDPAMCYISLRPQRHSYSIIKKNRDFVINLTTEKLAFAVDWCGVHSGRDTDKFKEMKLTPGKAVSVKAPLIVESPVNIECVVKKIEPLGTHDMFISQVMAIHADRTFLNPKTGFFDLAKAHPISYIHGRYFETGRPIGKFGFSVQKKKTKPKK